VLEPSGNLVVALAERIILGKRPRAARIEAPPGFVAVDTHVHTCYSPDSVADPAQVLLAAARRGLAGIAVTDHDTVEGAERAQTIAQQLKARGELPPDFLTIEGEEVSSRDGHVIGLFLHARVPPGLSAEDTVVAIHAQGGLAVLAHPLHPSGVGRRAAALPCDAIETVNMAEELHFSLSTGRANRKRVQFYAGLSKACLDVSDAHDPSAIGLGYTLVPGTALDEAGLRHALAAGETQACALANTRKLSRLAGGFSRSASLGLRVLPQAFGWGSHFLKRITGADRVRLRPRFGHGGLGGYLSLTKSI
jgi:predicted metal-dependent phosphoesterase TrpH